MSMLLRSLYVCFMEGNGAKGIDFTRHSFFVI